MYLYSVLKPAFFSVRSRTPFSQVSSSLAHGLSRVSLRGTLPRLSLAEARGNSVRPALFSSRPIKPRFSVAHASASLRHRLSLGISRNMPLGTPLMLRSLRHLPPLPHDCPAEIAAAISRAARREHKTKKSIHGEFTLHRQSFGLAQGLRFIEPQATQASSHSRSSAASPPESR